MMEHPLLLMMLSILVLAACSSSEPDTAREDRNPPSSITTTSTPERTTTTAGPATTSDETYQRLGPLGTVITEAITPTPEIIDTLHHPGQALVVRLARDVLTDTLRTELETVLTGFDPDGGVLYIVECPYNGQELAAFLSYQNDRLWQDPDSNASIQTPAGLYAAEVFASGIGNCEIRHGIECLSQTERTAIEDAMATFHISRVDVWTGDRTDEGYQPDHMQTPGLVGHHCE